MLSFPLRSSLYASLRWLAGAGRLPARQAMISELFASRGRKFASGYIRRVDVKSLMRFRASNAYTVTIPSFTCRRPSTTRMSRRITREGGRRRHERACCLRHGAGRRASAGFVSRRDARQLGTDEKPAAAHAFDTPSAGLAAFRKFLSYITPISA